MASTLLQENKRETWFFLRHKDSAGRTFYRLLPYKLVRFTDDGADETFVEPISISRYTQPEIKGHNVDVNVRDNQPQIERLEFVDRPPFDGTHFDE